MSAQQPSWMLVRLALETRTHHAQADADRLVLLEEAQPDRYRAYLCAVFGFESRYEEALVRTPGVDPQLVRTRMKTERLCSDLNALGLTATEIAALPRCQSVPSVFRNAAQALGWMFVVERNTLVHGLLRRHLASRIPDMYRSCSYLQAYGDTPGAKYRELGDALALLARGPSTPNQMVCAANEAFRAQRNWFTSWRQEHARPAPLAV